MPYQVNDQVVHPTHGVGRITALVTQRFFDVESRLYYEIAIERNTVWVPVDADAASGLRPLMPKAELAHFREVLRSRPTLLIADHQKRHLELRRRLKVGLFQDLCEVVRDLTARRWNKPLTEQDAATLRRALDRVCVEWAATDEVSLPEATAEVNALLSEGRQVHQESVRLPRK